MKQTLRVHYDHGTTDLGPFEDAASLYKQIKETSMFGFFVSERKFYLKDRILYLEVVEVKE